MLGAGMMDIVVIYDYIDTVKSFAFPISAALLISYPFFVLVWSSCGAQLSTGSVHNSSAEAHSLRSKAKRTTPPPLRKRVRGIQIKGDKGCSSSAPRFSCMVVAVLLFTLTACVSLVGGSLSFVSGFRGSSLGDAGAGGGNRMACERDSAACAAASGQLGAEEAPAAPRGATATAAAIGAGGLAVAALGCLALAAGPRAEGQKRSKKKAKSMIRAGSGILRRCASSKQVIYTSVEHAASSRDGANGIPVYPVPPDAPESMWHFVDLHVKDWLDEPEEGIFNYVNEIPNGALQKFELQTMLPMNVIREDAKGSKRLKAFGQPVPFNYGCFPQTFRDPEELDEIHGAPGDNDPLDVLDLCPQACGVGEVVRCRPLGAVCLIDEGQADWKILAVNIKADSPLAAARNIADAERIMPGKIEQALRWMDDFKQHSSKSETTLHYEILDADHATRIIQKDYEAWRRLVASAGDAGTARGHWIRQPAPLGANSPAKVVAMDLNKSLVAMGRVASQGQPSNLAGGSKPEHENVMSSGRGRGEQLTMRRQSSAGSDSEMSSAGVSQGRSSSDEEKGCF